MLLNEQTFDKTNQTLYKLIFPVLPVFLNSGINDIKNFTVNGNSALLPGLTISEQSMAWMGGQIKYPDKNISFNNLTVSFLIDEKLNNWKLFWKWLIFINNNKDKYVEDWNLLTTDAYLIYYDNWFGSEVLRMNFVNLWPNALSDIELTTKTDGSDILEGRITFSFDRNELID